MIHCSPDYSLKLLDEDVIRRHLKGRVNIPLHFYLLATIDSTNQFLKENPSSRPIVDICCAETQTQGRGRFGRTWHSPLAQNIYCSSRWHFSCPLSYLSPLSLVTSLAIVHTLSHLGIEESIRIKWPNDIFWHEKKLSGTLIEIAKEAAGQAEVIIGIGINVNATPPDERWCSLYDITNHTFDRNILIAELIIHLHRHIELFMAHGFTPFISSWKKVDYLSGHRIRVSCPTGTLHGHARGITPSGLLILEDEQGTLHCLSSGDASIHLS